MASQRVLGQNVSVIIIQDSDILDEVNCVRSFGFTYGLEIKGYIGETTNRKDSEPRKRSKRKREPEDPKLQDRTVLSDEVYRMKYGEDKPRDW